MIIYANCFTDIPWNMRQKVDVWDLRKFWQLPCENSYLQLKREARVYSLHGMFKVCVSVVASSVELERTNLTLENGDSPRCRIFSQPSSFMPVSHAVVHGVWGEKSPGKPCAVFPLFKLHYAYLAMDVRSKYRLTCASCVNVLLSFSRREILFFKLLGYAQ